MFKDNIFRNVTQHFMMQKGLTLEEGLILDYLISLYEHVDYYEPKLFCNKYYFWCTPNNIIRAFPLLSLTEARVIKCLNRLDYLKIIEQRKFGTLKYFNIPIPTMFEAASDDKFFYDPHDDERLLRVVDKIKYMSNRGW